MKILLGITFIFACSYVPTLWSYHSNDDVKTNREHKNPNIDTLVKTEESNISTTSETTTTVKHSVTEIVSKNETKNTTTNNTGNSSEYTSYYYESDEARIHFYQLSDTKEKLNNYNCTEKYERTSLPGSCDGYIECKNGVATSLLCQDGLYFDPENGKSKMPCQYSCDVPCTNETPFTRQVRYLSRECPHKFGYFKIQDKYNCSSFRICEFGVAYDFECPNGLAFRSDNLRCDWPHKVPECDAEGYASFQCPDKKEEYIFFRSPTDCQVYYTCVYGVPRRQVCGKYMGFDVDSLVCAPADRVEECSTHLKSAAIADRRTRYLENKYTQDYDDGDGYLRNRNINLSFSRRVRKPKIISFPKYKKY